jgi:hypothetical protein
MFTFKVTPDDGDPFDVPAGTRDVLMWEKNGRDRSISGLMSNLKATDMYAIAHIAARRQQLFTGTLAEFEETCEISTDSMFEVEEQPDPTRLAPSNGQSSHSQSTPGSRRKSGAKKTSG